MKMLVIPDMDTTTSVYIMLGFCNRSYFREVMMAESQLATDAATSRTQLSVKLRLLGACLMIREEEGGGG
jgi:hypothetical protein